MSNMEEVSIKNKANDKKNKKNFKVVNQVCMIYSIGFFFIFIFNLIMNKIYLKNNYPEPIFIFAKNLFGVILMFLLTFFFGKNDLEEGENDMEEYKVECFGPKKFFQFLFINFGLHYIFFYVGWGINKLLAPLMIKLFYRKKKKLNAFSVIDNEDLEIWKYIKFIALCITGPISEEFAYRYFLIKRLARYDITLSIFCSGIIFGYTHMNAGQFFHCMASGIVYAYSYVKTNNILIPIFYHIVLNSYEYIISSELRFLKLIIGLIGLALIEEEKENNSPDLSNQNESCCKSCCALFKSYWMWIIIIEGNLCIFYDYYEQITN